MHNISGVVFNEDWVEVMLNVISEIWKWEIIVSNVFWEDVCVSKRERVEEEILKYWKWEAD